MGAHIEQWTISSEGASRCVEVARRQAAELGIPMSIAVVDAAGVLKAFHRMDGAKILSVESSQRKAYTAAATAFPTREYFDTFRDGPEVVLLSLLPGATSFGGGHPIVDQGVVIGGVGVGGGSAEQDAQIAAAAAAAIG
jgi:uncharacterized protein GlcG (DUF336 family)